MNKKRPAVVAFPLIKKLSPKQKMSIDEIVSKNLKEFKKINSKFGILLKMCELIKKNI